ncbi:MAG TPA: alanine racemase [Burkholderiales bacterium]|nr:alanine racemase [Burkholderiales bacterium]
MPRPIRATFRASALRHNLQVARESAGEARVWAVMKANAYGHGLERAARALADADGFAVLDFQEAVRLRLAGVTKPILMLEGFFRPLDVNLIFKYQLTPVIHNVEQVELLKHMDFPADIDVYVKVNSGMNRLGFGAEDLRVNYNTLRLMSRTRELTLMTHFADAEGSEGIHGQLRWFNELTSGLEAPRSLANSAALLRFKEAREGWVRPGIMLYGCSPFPDWTAADIGLQPVMTLTSELIGVQDLAPGERVGYGFGFEAKAPMTLGVVACGYADGYPRHAPTGTPVLVKGRRTRVVGRVSMDMLCVDITDIEDAYIGSPVTLWGEGLPAEEVAAAAGTVSYELLCALAPRVPVHEEP